MAQRKPCPTCPWRKDQHAQTIPGFKLDLAEGLVDTMSDQFGAPMMACHQSTPERDVHCVGWLVRHGYNNIGVRMSLLTGKMRPEELEIGADWPDLHDDYDEVLAKLRADTEREEANG